MNGDMIIKLTCNKCNFSNFKFEKYMTLNLAIPNKTSFSSVSIERLVDDFFKPENLEDFVCKKCNVPRRHSMTRYIWNPSNIIFLHFKRFEFKAMTKELSKINTKIAFRTDQLSFADYLFKKKGPVDLRYRLVGFVNHYGMISSGHYIAYF